jgi:hypothetical protein
MSRTANLPNSPAQNRSVLKVYADLGGIGHPFPSTIIRLPS